jgi:hypothetical protein
MFQDRQPVSVPIKIMEHAELNEEIHIQQSERFN